MGWLSNEKPAERCRRRAARAVASSVGSKRSPSACPCIQLRPRKSEVLKLRSPKAIPTRLRPSRKLERNTRIETATRRVSPSLRKLPLEFRGHSRDIRDPHPPAQLIVKQAAASTQQANQHKVRGRSGRHIHLCSGPRVGASKIVTQHVHRTIVIGIDDRKTHAAFGCYFFGPHVSMKMIDAPRLDWNILRGFAEFQVSAAAKIQPNGAHAVGERSRVKIDRHVPRRAPSPTQSAVLATAQAFAVPHYRMIYWFVVRQTRRGERFDPYLSGIHRAVVLNQFVKERKRSY